MKQYPFTLEPVLEELYDLTTGLPLEGNEMLFMKDEMNDYMAAKDEALELEKKGVTI